MEKRVFSKVEKRGFCRNINFSAKSRIEKEHFFLEKTQPFLPIFFQKKTFIFVFFRLFRGGTGKNLYVYVYVYVYFYIYRVSFLSVLRTEKKQNHQSAVPLRGTALGALGFWEKWSL